MASGGQFVNWKHGSSFRNRGRNWDVIFLEVLGDDWEGTLGVSCTRGRLVRAKFVQGVLRVLKFSRPTRAQGDLADAERPVERPNKMPRVVEPLSSMPACTGPPGKPTVFIMGDSQVVCGWLNGSMSCFTKALPTIMDSQIDLYELWKSDSIIPCHGASDWIGHIFREVNTAADAAADIAALSRNVELIRGAAADTARENCVAIKICFDGTAGKINYQPAIGIVFDVSTVHLACWTNAFTASIPLITGSSSTQAELLAGSTAIKILKY